MTRAGPGETGFTLDLARCVGCGACVLACRIENQLPPGVSWRRVLQVNEPRLQGGPTFHLSVACHHCENPPCARSCPTGALSRQEDGTVQLHADRCIGCRYCEMACPFGAPSFDEHAGVMTKCHLCHHRTTLGLGPACVVACPTQALGFLGDGEDHLEEDSFRRADEIPGFSDPADAKPRLWVSEPGGTIRSEWYEALRSLMAGGKEDSHGS